MERTELIQIRVSPAEKERIRANASAAGARLSEYVRAQALGPERRTPNRTTQNVDGPNPAEVARLAQELKGQGMTTPVATREARKRLGQPPESMSR